MPPAEQPNAYPSRGLPSESPSEKKLRTGRKTASRGDLWRSEVLAQYELGVAEAELAALAAAALDRHDVAEQEVSARGVLIDGRFGARANPALAAARDAAVLFLRLCRELGFDAPAAVPAMGALELRRRASR